MGIKTKFGNSFLIVSYFAVPRNFPHVIFDELRSLRKDESNDTTGHNQGRYQEVNKRANYYPPSIVEQEQFGQDPQCRR